VWVAASFHAERAHPLRGWQVTRGWFTACVASTILAAVGMIQPGTIHLDWHAIIYRFQVPCPSCSSSSMPSTGCVLCSLQPIGSAQELSERSPRRSDLADHHQLLLPRQVWLALRHEPDLHGDPPTPEIRFPKLQPQTPDNPSASSGCSKPETLNPRPQTAPPSPPRTRGRRADVYGSRLGMHSSLHFSLQPPSSFLPPPSSLPSPSHNLSTRLPTIINVSS
jgi:hypothetical protein